MSWEEAYDTIVKEFIRIKETYGPEAIIFCQGTGRDHMAWISRLAYSVGSPNWSAFGPGSGLACYMPKVAAMQAILGDVVVADMSQCFPDRYNNPNWKTPKCIVIWGNNPVVANSDLFFGHWIVDCMKRGSELIVVDPRCTWLASKAKIWLQIRPGTDTALALGMLNVIINKELHDKEFVEKWCYGFDRLKERVQKYTPEKVSEITWVPKERIIEAARMYAKSKPACIQWGVAIDHHRGAVETAHAILCLKAVTGNIDVPGGNIIVRFPKRLCHIWLGGWGYDELLTEEQKSKRYGLKEYPLLQFGFRVFQPDVWLEAMFTGKPYQAKAAWIQGTNTIVASFGDPKRVYEAFKKMEFVVVVDFFITPTVAAFADIVLPAAMFPERDCIKVGWDRVQAINKAVEPPGECKSDIQICFELGKRLNSKAWPWNSLEEMFNYLLEPLGLTFNELKEKGPVYYKFEYKKYEKGLLRADGKPGFNTPTGKIELYSTLFERWGYDPLPDYEEPPESPISTPMLAKEYPLILITGARSYTFFHSEHRQPSTGLREIHQDPILEIHPQTAQKLGIRDGDWVYIENAHGKCRQRAKLTPTIHPNMVHAEHGWWFPEKEMNEPTLGGVWESNVNLLIPAGMQGKKGFGYPFKTGICKVYKVG
ncbi:MAG: molybdopterin-dependent oxidoreductase [Candidatus Bathyarchaeia archaeon]